MKHSSSFLKDFGKNVRKLREKQGLSQDNLALKADLDRTYLSGIERGERNPSLRNIGKISKALSVEPVDLFEGLAFEE